MLRTLATLLLVVAIGRPTLAQTKGNKGNKDDDDADAPTTTGADPPPTARRREWDNTQGTNANMGTHHLRWPDVGVLERRSTCSCGWASPAVPAVAVPFGGDPRVNHRAWYANRQSFLEHMDAMYQHHCEQLLNEYEARWQVAWTPTQPWDTERVRLEAEALGRQIDLEEGQVTE